MTDSKDEGLSARLEDQVVTRLMSEGLIGHNGSPARRGPGIAIPGGMLALALAGLIGLQWTAQPPPGQLYVLALYGGENYREAAGGDRSRAREYGDWARAHGKGDATVVGGEELEPAVATLGAAPSDQMLGFFTVRAKNDADAVALAKTTPHLRYGGTVSVRPAAT